MHAHSLFWHTIHYLPLVLIIASAVLALVTRKTNNLKKYLAAFASVGVVSHAADSGFAFHVMEPCFLYIAVLAGVAAISAKNLVAKTF